MEKRLPYTYFKNSELAGLFQFSDYELHTHIVAPFHSDVLTSFESLKKIPNPMKIPVCIPTSASGILRIACAPTIALLGALTSVQASVVLPIEVFGVNRFGTNDPAIVREVQLSAPAGVSARGLEFQIHGASFPGKISIQVNSQTYQEIRNDNANLTIEEDGKAYGGVGGLWQTLKMQLSLPSTAGINGVNKIKFRYNGTNGRSMGFRIISLNLLDQNGNKLVAESEFQTSNPDTWAAPIAGAAAVNEGKVLWETATLLKSPGQAAIRAKCAMCHTPSGSDLKYFNYSNESIIARSRFHGLSETDGKKIASYIRAQNIVNPGRPWNPPYQPGPGLDALPGDMWAAGAGVDWVLPDAEAQKYLPGNGTDLAANVDSNRRYYAFNKREVPVKIQFLDWNHWLTEDHLVDLFDEDFFANSNVKKNYDKIRNGLLGSRGMTKDEYVSGPMREEIRDWLGNEAFTRFASEGWQNQSGVHSSRYFLGGHLPALVRLWGLIHEFDLHDLGEQWYGLQGEKRTFPSYRTAFNTAPHILGTNNDSNGVLKDTVYTVIDKSLPWYRDWDGVTDSWYQMQTILNGGQRNSFRGGHHVVDWKYITYFGNAGAGRTSWGFKYGDVKGAPIYALTMGWKSLQEGDTSFGPDGAGSTNGTENRWWGYALREVRPSIANLFSDPFNGMSNPEIAAIIEPIYSAFVTTFCTFTLDQWQVNDDEFGGPTTYTLGVDTNQDKYQLTFLNEAKRMRDEFGVSHALINGMMDMGYFKWPGSGNANQDDWNSGRAAVDNGIGIPSGVTVTPAPGHMTISWQPVAGATSYNVYRTRAGDGVPLPAGFLIEGTSFKEPKTQAGQVLKFSVSANVGKKVGQRSAEVSGTGVSGLVLHYTFNSDVGTDVADQSGNGFWGKLISGAERVAGAQGGGVKLSGNAGYRNSSFVSSSQNLAQWVNRSCTISFRAKRFANGKSNNLDSTQALIGGTPNGANAARMSIGALDTQGRIGVRYYGGNSVVTTEALAMNSWQQVTITRDQGNGDVRIYFDGVLKGSGTSSSGYKIARAHSIGRIDNFAPGSGDEFFRYFPAEIDDVRIYDKILNASEISALATSKEPDLTAANVTSSYTEWKSLVDWGTLPTSARNEDADPDGDGVTNRMERVFGTNPRASDAGKQVGFVKESAPDGLLTMRLEYKKTAGDMIYEVVQGPDLENRLAWPALSSDSERWDATTNSYHMIWKPSPDQPRGFASIRVTPR